MTRQTQLTEQDRDRIAQAVSRAEAESAGEVVTIVSDRSDTYADIALIWSALAAFVALIVFALKAPFYLGLWDWLTNDWANEWNAQALFAVAALVAMVKFLGVWLFLLWRPLRLWLTPRPIRHHRVRDRANMLFKAAAEKRTTGRTGILIYLSLEEHRAEIVADEAIAARVDPSVWGDALAPLLAHLREGRMAEGLVEAVSRVGKVLATHLPVSPGDVNELPDRVIEV
ncbi:MAG: TPM domain-containing protein [Novosphingobium sp.]